MPFVTSERAVSQNCMFSHYTFCGSSKGGFCLIFTDKLDFCMKLDPVYSVIQTSDALSARSRVTLVLGGAKRDSAS